MLPWSGSGQALTLIKRREGHSSTLSPSLSCPESLWLHNWNRGKENSQKRMAQMFSSQVPPITPKALTSRACAYISCLARWELALEIIVVNAGSWMDFNPAQKPATSVAGCQPQSHQGRYLCKTRRSRSVTFDTAACPFSLLSWQHAQCLPVALYRTDPGAQAESLWEMSAQLCVLHGRAAGPIDLPASRTGMQEEMCGRNIHRKLKPPSKEVTLILEREKSGGGGSALPILESFFFFTLSRVAGIPGQSGTRSPWIPQMWPLKTCFQHFTYFHMLKFLPILVTRTKPQHREEEKPPSNVQLSLPFWPFVGGKTPFFS